jgi:hypothetical protein
MYQRVRAPGDGVARLEADRPPGPDLARLAGLVASGALDPAPGLPC